MDFPTSPTSITGQWFFINLASDVPPDVESLGKIPVSFNTVFCTIDEKFPGTVKKLSPETLNVDEMSKPNSSSIKFVSSSHHFVNDFEE